MALNWILVPAALALVAFGLMSLTSRRRARATPTPAELGDLLAEASDKVTRSDQRPPGERT